MLIDRGGPVDLSTLDPELPAVSLYNGEVQIKFNPIEHRYQVSDVCVDGGKPFCPPSVTRILSAMIDKSEPLIAWATKCSREKIVELIQPGRAYTADEIQRISYAVQDASREIVKKACSTGHDTHSWVERYLIARAGQGDYPAPPTVDMPEVRSACSAARKWILEVDLQPASIERIVYSRSHRVVGITDIAGAVARVDGELSIVDWKTSNSIEGHAYEWQLAAYARMYSEMTGQEVTGRWIIRLDKQDSTAHPKQLPAEDLNRDWMGFLGLLVAHTRLKEMGTI